MLSITLKENNIMGAELAFTYQEIILAGALLFALALGIIFLGRFYLNKQSQSGLSEKHKNKIYASPLIGRNKYPEVDIFSYRNQIFMFGLVFSLLIVIGVISSTSYEQEVIIPDYALDLETDIEIEPPRSAEPPPPPPPPPPPVITEVPNEEILLEEEDIEFVDQSVSEDTEVEVAVVEPGPKKEEAPPPPPPPPPPPEVEVAEIFQVVEEMPRFIGCEDLSDKKEKYDCASKKLLQFIYGNIKYPTIALENSIEGTVVVRFVVNTEGKVLDAKILRDIGGTCGREALRIVQLMNKNGVSWLPGKQRGRPVNVQMNLPVKFKLITS